MKKLELLDEVIDKYYDQEMTDNELIHFEAKMALSDGIREYCANECYKNFQISNSIKLSTMRCEDRAKRITDNFEKKLSSRFTLNVDINFNSVAFKSIYKNLRNIFLNIRRNNS